MHDDSTVAILNNARKLLTPVCQSISKLSLEFDGNFNQIDSVPPELTMRITNPSQATLTLSQIAVYKFKSKKSAIKQTESHSNINQCKSCRRETPVITYTNLKLYLTVRSKNLVDHLHNIGICCSYKRVLDILSGWAEIHRQNNQVIPLKLQGGLFTSFTQDNIDKNSSSKTASRHFHGTSICAFQAKETPMDGTDRNANMNIRFNNPTSTISSDLPSSYTDIKDVCSKTPKVYTCPTPSVNLCKDLINNDILFENKKKEIMWMENVVDGIKKSWSSYHASNQHTDSVYPRYNKVIFPLLKDAVHTVNMQHHLISCFIDYNRTLDTDQVTAVDCSDQPVYALSKICQWFYPSKFGFPMYFPMLGALHIEKALLIVHSKLIGGTGVDAIIGYNRINIIGLQNAVLDVNHIYESRYSLKLCSATLYACLKGTHKSGSQIDLLPWAQVMASECMMFKYWLTILQFEIDFLVFLRSIREGNFSLYVVTLRTLIKCFFYI